VKQIFMLEWAEEFTGLGPRRGSRPAIRRETRVQVDQFPAADMAQRLAADILRLPNVHEKESQIADPSVRAFWIPDEFTCTGGKAFICDHEFCHLHPAPGTTLHMVLSEPVARQAALLGWGEPHPLADRGFLPTGLSIIYAPRTEPEFRIVMELVKASYRFVTSSHYGK
jgi:hypothetical protein